MEVEKKNSHSEIERRRRNKMNQCINDLSTMIPLPPSVGKKPDKMTVLRFAVQHMKALQGSTEPSKETNHKPSFMSDDDLRNLITEASGGFIIVVECDRGQVLYVTDSVEKILNISQANMIGFDFYELVHSKDVAMVKTQLSTTASEGKDEKSYIKKPDVVEESIGNAENLCPGAKRSFLCRMKKVTNAEDIKNMGTKSTTRKTKANVFVDDNDTVTISYEGFLKSWPPKKEMKSSNDPNSRSCLVAVGRILEIDTEETDYSKLGQIRDFETRQRADATFVRVDQNFTKIFGYCPDEVIGNSAYSFLHKDDLRIVAGSHQKALTTKGVTRPEMIYRFRAKAGHYVPVKTTSVVFRNPYSKEIDYIATRNVVMKSMPSNVIQSGTKNVASDRFSEQQNMDESLRHLLTKLENLNDNKSNLQRKRGLVTDREPQKQSSPSDIGVLIAEQAEKIGQQPKINSQSAKYTNVDSLTESQSTVANGLRPAQDTNYRQRDNFEVTSGSNEEQQNSLADGILLEQLEGIQGAINAMENTAAEEDSFSLLINVIENEDLGVLNDMPWNFM
ncbi:protein cycle-like isoform X2 [Dendronephthya gigantea]|nr:protein cycle-like isoform X2 [Dendronephthya gigantea]